MRRFEIRCGLVVQQPRLYDIKIATSSDCWNSILRIEIGLEYPKMGEGKETDLAGTDVFLVLLFVGQQDHLDDWVKMKRRFSSLGDIRTWLGSVHRPVLHALVGDPFRLPGWGKNLTSVMEMMSVCQGHLDTLFPQLAEEREEREAMFAQVYSGT